MLAQSIVVQAITTQTRPTCRASSNIPADVVAQMSQLSMCDVNESHPGDAGDQQLPSPDEAASASNGVGHTHKGPIATSDEPTVGDALASGHTERVQHLKILLGQSASDLDLQVLKLKAERAEMKREKARLSAQLRNTKRKMTPVQPRHQTEHQRPPGSVRHARARAAGEGPPERPSGGFTVVCSDLRHHSSLCIY